MFFSLGSWSRRSLAIGFGLVVVALLGYWATFKALSASSPGSSRTTPVRVSTRDDQKKAFVDLLLEDVDRAALRNAGKGKDVAGSKASAARHRTTSVAQIRSISDAGKPAIDDPTRERQEENFRRLQVLLRSGPGRSTSSTPGMELPGYFTSGRPAAAPWLPAR